MLRYYGIYAKHHKQSQNFTNVFHLKSTDTFLSFIAVEAYDSSDFYGYDPLKCPKCGKSMLRLKFITKNCTI